MLCRKPFVKAGVAFPCGQCMPCRYNRRRMWTHRLMLESLCHAEKAFVTLTYNDVSLPRNSDGNGVVVPDHLQLFLKRLRNAVNPVKIRFYAVGEYGDVTKRPHYHLFVYGYPTCSRDRTLRRGFSLEPLWHECCATCRLYGNAWGYGNVDLGTVTKDSASYVAGYTVKRMTSADDRRLEGRTPEFCRMSLRPGIGADAMWDVASALMQYGLDDGTDVPQSLQFGRSKLPLGRYLRGRLREFIGKDGGTPEEVIKSMEEEMRPLREGAFASSSSFAEAVARAGDQIVRNIESRNAVFRKDKSL